MIDIAIIGGGPAGLSAAINGIQSKKKVMVFGKGMDSSLLYKAEKVDNYLGLPEITGKNMMEAFYSHAKAKGVLFKDSKVTQIIPAGDYFMLNADTELINAKTIIIATGINRSKAIKGETKFLGAGLSYCATCDAMLYMDKTVAIISETPGGEQDLRLLSDMCQKVYYLPLYKFEKELPQNVSLLSGKPMEILGTDYVSGINISDSTIKCDGVFMIKNVLPPSSIIYDLETIGNVVMVNRHMETNIPGVFAAGDCTGAPYQIAKAVGEGLVAVQRAIKML